VSCHWNNSHGNHSRGVDSGVESFLHNRLLTGCNFAASKSPFWLSYHCAAADLDSRPTVRVFRWSAHFRLRLGSRHGLSIRSKSLR
jgi:hypothetical protein